MSYTHLLPPGKVDLSMFFSTYYNAYSYCIQLQAGYCLVFQQLFIFHCFSLFVYKINGRNYEQMHKVIRSDHYPSSFMFTHTNFQPTCVRKLRICSCFECELARYGVMEMMPLNFTEVGTKQGVSFHETFCLIQ